MISSEKRGEVLVSAASEKKSFFPKFNTYAKEKTLWFMFLRTIVNTILLTITLFYQINDSSVIRPQDLLSIYSLIGLTYFVTTVCALMADRIQNKKSFIIGQIIYDILFITGLIYMTGPQEAIFTFLYLLTIVFSSILFFKTGALYTAALTSICFSSLLILDPIVVREKHLLTLFFNNMSFFIVAILAGYLSEQFQQYRVRLKEEEESVRELQGLNKLIMDNMTSGLITTDLHNQIIYTNKMAETITGLFYSDIYKKNIFDVLPDLKRHWIKKAPSHKKDIRIRQSFIFKKSDQDELTLGFALAPLRDAENQKCGSLLIFEDLTKVLEMEQHLHRSDKLAAIGKLAAGIAHEIRNPLAAVSGSIEMLSKELNVRDENKRLMDIILKETDRLNSLVNEFLDYVRPTEKKQEAFNINQTIEDTVTALCMDKSLMKNVHILFEPMGRQLTFKGDKEKMKQVFWNLLLNAKQAMPQGGDIRIKTSKDDNELNIEISDTGDGIEEKLLSKIFDPFFTTKPKGTGLGLSMVHKIIEAHQGRIGVSSKIGKGTTFTLTLPING